MAEIKKFEDLKIWQKARLLSKEIWAITQADLFKQNFALRNQLDRAAGSIMDISEGFSREGRKEFMQFLSVAKGSCAEVKSQLYRALDRELISQNKFNELYAYSEEISKMLSGLMAYLKNSNISGNKFKEPYPDYTPQTED